MSTFTVDIVLSTYNGALFLSEQIKSIQSQKHTQWRLWVRDDGSSDDTLSIITNFIKHDSRIQWSNSHSEPKNQGAPQSFHILLAALPEDCEFFLLCDQDDVWKPEKITSLLEAYATCDSQKPTLIFSDLELVNAKGEKLQPSQMKHMGFDPANSLSVERLAAQNIVTGCSLGGNKALLLAALPIPHEALMHDWWLALVAADVGKIVYCSKALVSYRQHTHNASGGSQKKGLALAVNKLVSGDQSFLKLMQQRFAQIEALNFHFQKRGLKAPQIKALLKLETLSAWLRVKSALKLNFLPQGLERKVLFLGLLATMRRPQSAPQDKT